MKQEKIGKFIAQIRNEKKMTQKELATKLNVTDRAVSNWENGRRMPDYTILMPLCEELEITLNELFTGERLSESDFKQKAEKNLLIALKNSSFTLKERIQFYKKKWLKEHLFSILFCGILEIILTLIFYNQKVEIYLILSFIFISIISLYIYFYNQMMRFIEYNAYDSQK